VSATPFVDARPKSKGAVDLRRPLNRKFVLAATTTLVMVASLFALVAGATAAEIDPLLSQQIEKAGSSGKVLVFVHGENIGAATRAVTNSGLELGGKWDRIGVAVAVGTGDQVARAATQPGVTFLEADRPIEFSMETSQKATRYDEARQMTFQVPTGEASKPGKGKGKAKGVGKNKNNPPPTKTVGNFTGSGVSVAVVDSGIDAQHPLLTDADGSKVVRNLKLTPGCVVGVFLAIPAPCFGPRPDAGDMPTVWADTGSNSDTDTLSNGGHGTHVAGIAAGFDSSAHPLHGSAPGAKLIGLSVGQVISVYGGNEGLNWVLENHESPCEGCPPILAVNNSYGPTGGGNFSKSSATSKLQDALVADGVTVVWAAGNDGGNGSVNRTNPPGASPTPGILSVANYDDAQTGSRDNKLATSSSRGKNGDRTTYPDLSAPGTLILSSCRAYMPVCQVFGSMVDPDYFDLSGTSMAAPHVAGYVAVLQEAAREGLGRYLTPAEVEDVLEDTAYQFEVGGEYVPDPRNGDHTTSFDKGHGLVDMVAALGKLLNASTPAGPDVAAQCANGTIVTDPEGDVGDGDAFDILSTTATDTVDGFTGAITFAVRVKNLGETNPPNSPSIGYIVNFDHGGRRLYVEAARGPNGGEFVFGSVGTVSAVVASTTVRTPISDISGAFKDDVIEITLPMFNLSAASGSSGVLGNFETVSGKPLNSRRRPGSLALPTAPALMLTSDRATGKCQYVLGTGSRVTLIEEPEAPPAPTPDGTVSQAGPHTWSGGPFSNDAGTNGEGPCAGEQDLTCDREFIDVQVPAEGSGLTVSIDAPDDSDFDLYLFDPAGTLVSSSATAASDESVGVSTARNGVYRVEVRAWDADDVGYSGTAALRPADGSLAIGDPYEWSGDAPDLNIFYCDTVSNANCDNEAIRIAVPESGADLTITIASEVPGEDFYLQVFAPDGTPLAFDDGVGDDEVSLRVAESGIYTVSVASRFSPLGGFTGTATLS
jgi:serine protease AprX